MIAIRDSMHIFAVHQIVAPINRHSAPLDAWQIAPIAVIDSEQGAD
jgi:hypothetical protein